jgi:hypothetical protein
MMYRSRSNDKVCLLPDRRDNARAEADFNAAAANPAF